MTDQQDYTQVLFSWMAEQPEEWLIFLRILRTDLYSEEIQGIALRMQCTLDYGIVREQVFLPDYPGPLLRGALDDNRKKILERINEEATDAA